MDKFWAKIHQWLGIPYALHVRRSGAGPRVVMLHGIASSSVSWNNLVPPLSSDFECLTIDLLGFGESPKPEWYSYTPNEHVACIHHTFKKQKLKEPFILVGHSMGALLALYYASKYPHRIKRLILLSPPIYLTEGEAQKARRIWRDLLYSRAYKYLRLHKNFTLKGARGIEFLAMKNNPFSITQRTWLPFSKSLEECIEKQNVVADIEQIHCPVDIFYGTLDQLLIKKNIKVLSKYPNVQIHAVRSAHLINKGYAKTVAKILVNS
jgi:pimeloyl-ACP methyl ester carboxylesterase